MSKVRLIARVFGVLGWITLIIGAIGILFVLFQLGWALLDNNTQVLPPFGGVVALFPLPLVPLGASLGLFTVWALLTSLCELHKQGERTLEALYDLKPRARVGYGSGTRV